MPKALDITNQKFGHLVAIERAPSRSGKTYWKCQCDCGTIKEIQTSHLTNGAIQSCGTCSYSKKNFKFQKENQYCILCGKEYISNNYARKYCYECSPEGVGPVIALRYKKRALKHLLVQYKGGKCEKCGYSNCEGALQFHHTDPTEKEFSLSHINLNGTDVSIEKLYREVDKCVLLCANCHSEEHYLEDIDLQ